jgi:hypothetical protein
MCPASPQATLCLLGDGAEVLITFLPPPHQRKVVGVRRTFLLLASMALTTLLVGGVALGTLGAGDAQAQTVPDKVLDASCQPPDSGPTGLTTFFRNTAVAAQTFTAEHTGLLSRAKVRVWDYSNDDTGIVMEIRTVDSSGRPTGVVLASTTIPASEVPQSHYGVATGHFNPGAPVKAGQHYALALSTSTGVEGNGPAWQGSNTNSCPGTVYHAHESWPGEFRASSPSFDVFFSTFVTLRSAPRTKDDCKNGGYKEFGFKNKRQCIASLHRDARTTP